MKEDFLEELSVKENGDQEKIIEDLSSDNLSPDEIQELQKRTNMLNKYCLDNGILVVTLVDDKYPELLKASDMPPMVLFTKGNLALLNEELVWVYGDNYAMSSKNDVECSAIKIALDAKASNKVCVTTDVTAVDLVVQQTCKKIDSPSILILTDSFDGDHLASNARHDIIQTTLDNNGLVMTLYPEQKGGGIDESIIRLMSDLLNDLVIVSLQQKTDAETKQLCNWKTHFNVQVVFHPIYAMEKNAANDFAIKEGLKPYIGFPKKEILKSTNK